MAEKYLDETVSFEERARELVSKMTLEEKVFQTLHKSAAIERLGIKGYNWWNEALHGVARAGVATVFPQAIALAATFDEELLEKIGDTVSTEGRAKFNMQQAYDDTDIYKGLTFWAPNVNIFRDPRWGRGHETYGEDPYLTSRLAVRFIRGMQGSDGKYLKVAACAKHFAVHSGPEDMRHHFNAQVSGKDLYETYLPAFKACVKEANVEAVMGAYNRTNGEPCCASKTLLQKILRKKWGFKGHVTSDCWALKDIHEGHMVTSTEEESVALAMKNGCDLNCGNLNVHLLKAVEDGLITEAQITEAVTRLYITKMKLGIFDDAKKVPYSALSYDLVDCKEHRHFNEQVSMRCLTLLKNENKTLPLDKKTIKTLGIIGPNADNRKALIGNYEGTASEYVTVLEGIRHLLGEEVTIRYSEGCHLYKDRVSGLATADDRLSEAKAVVDASDAIVLCLGLDPGLEGEEGDQGNEFASGDKPNLLLPGIQEQLLHAVWERAGSKPVILVLMSGSALNVSWADEHIPAILQAWYPGAQGGNAIAKVLFGEASPEGKLPVTFYRSDAELPAFTDYAMKNRTYRYMEHEALYPFGYGLTYTSFLLTEAKADRNEISAGEKLHLTACLTNQGDFDAAETIQVYVCAKGVKDAPKYQLKGLKKYRVAAKESTLVSIELPDTAFALYEEDGSLVLHRGEYEIWLGSCQPDSRSLALTKSTPAQFTIQCNQEAVLEGATESAD